MKIARPQTLNSLPCTRMRESDETGSPESETHVPSAQEKPSAQARSQPPQCALELVRSTQVRSHAVRPSSHSPKHSPVEQTSPEGQALPHAPQFEGSVVGSVHVRPPQSMAGSAHSRRFSSTATPSSVKHPMTRVESAKAPVNRTVFKAKRPSTDRGPVTPREPDR